LERHSDDSLREAHCWAEEHGRCGRIGSGRTVCPADRAEYRREGRLERGGGHRDGAEAEVRSIRSRARRNF
jgi:hypothetical protein